MGIKALIALCLSIFLTVVGVVGYIGDVSYANSVAQDTTKIVQGDNSAAQHLGETTTDYAAGSIQDAIYIALIVAVVSTVIGVLAKLGIR